MLRRLLWGGQYNVKLCGRWKWKTWRIIMYETMVLDSRTIIVKSDNDKEMSEVIDFITKKDKETNLELFFKFAAANRKAAKNYKFNREECYAE
jgi:hypothetical protein